MWELLKLTNHFDSLKFIFNIKNSLSRLKSTKQTETTCYLRLNSQINLAQSLATSKSTNTCRLGQTCGFGANLHLKLQGCITQMHGNEKLSQFI